LLTKLRALQELASVMETASIMSSNHHIKDADIDNTLHYNAARRTMRCNTLNKLGGNIRRISKEPDLLAIHDGGLSAQALI
jgi:transcriptional regulator of acetoin/glycerol metabolism